jgi:hypothetical protein
VDRQLVAATRCTMSAAVVDGKSPVRVCTTRLHAPIATPSKRRVPDQLPELVNRPMNAVITLPRVESRIGVLCSSNVQFPLLSRLSLSSV